MRRLRASRAEIALRGAGRRGMTLLEVFLALAIFIGALTAITQIISTGSRAAIQTQLQSEAALRAESKMAEAVAGAINLQTANNVAFEDDDAWAWSLVVADGTHVDTMLLTVLVTHKTRGGRVDGQSQMARLIRNPQVFLDAAGASSSTGLFP
ncbi:MAG: hypothetical protein KF774_13880 [Planctomyces sp.]|nr:hypothetical protein [Planctomyces sp.]